MIGFSFGNSRRNPQGIRARDNNPPLEFQAQMPQMTSQQTSMFPPIAPSRDLLQRHMGVTENPPNNSVPGSTPLQKPKINKTRGMQLPPFMRRGIF